MIEKDAGVTGYPFAIIADAMEKNDSSAGITLRLHVPGSQDRPICRSYLYIVNLRMVNRINSADDFSGVANGHARRMQLKLGKKNAADATGHQISRE